MKTLIETAMTPHQLAEWHRTIVSTEEAQKVSDTFQGVRIRQLLDQIDLVIAQERRSYHDVTLIEIINYVILLRRCHNLRKQDNLKKTGWTYFDFIRPRSPLRHVNFFGEGERISQRWLRLNQLLDQIDDVIDDEAKKETHLDESLGQLIRYVMFLNSVHQGDKQHHRNMLRQVTHVDNGVAS